ncbi:MAG: hypothetical protein AB8F74_08060, partial [Saprospiraceae bacterium]
MKYSKLLFFFALTVLLAFSSCKKEELSEVTETIGDVEVTTRTHNALVSQMQASTTNSDGLDLGCFSINFPFDLLVDDETVTINAAEDFEDAIFQDAVFIDFVYPVTITYPEDGTTEEIADGEALGDAFAICIPDTGWNEDLFPVFLINDMNSCYTLSYPLNLTDGQGETYTANDEDELVDLVANNPNLYFEFPFDLIDEDGVAQTAENEEELFNLLLLCEDTTTNPGGPVDTTDCWAGYNPFADCFEFVYPYDILDLDGNTVTIENEDDFVNSLFNGTLMDFVYPVTIINLDGDEVVVNNQEGLQAVFDVCFGGNGNGGGSGGGSGGGGSVNSDVPVIVFVLQSDSNSGEECYSLVYPIAYTNIDTGETGSFDEQGILDYLNGGTFGFEIIDFPISVISTATSEEVIFETSIEYGI